MSWMCPPVDMENPRETLGKPTNMVIELRHVVRMNKFWFGVLVEDEYGILLKYGSYSCVLMALYQL